MSGAPPNTGATVVVMCGLPACGKTTTAGRLHGELGGVLIRSCDVYEELGISLPEWVRRTHGFTIRVAEYDVLRDEAYRVMARRLETVLAAGADRVVVDAVHGEVGKRHVVYAVCRAQGARPILVVCRCDDPDEIRRRLAARCGRERDPEHEASDIAVYDDIARRWRDPSDDRLLDGSSPAIVTYDTMRGTVVVTAHEHSNLDDVVGRIVERLQSGPPRGDRAVARPRPSEARCWLPRHPSGDR